MKTVVFAYNDIKFLEFVEDNVNIFEKFANKIHYYIITDISNCDETMLELAMCNELNELLRLAFYRPDFNLHIIDVPDFTSFISSEKIIYFIFDDYEMFDYDYEKILKSFINNETINNLNNVYVR